MIKDGQYAWYQYPDGKEFLVGRFEIRNGAVIFASEADKWNMDRIPPGPMSGYTKSLLSLLIVAGEIMYLGKL